MKALKALVIGMGLLIFVGLGLVGWGVSRTMGNHSPASPPVHAPVSGGEPVAAARPSAPGSYYAVDLPLPAGGKLEQIVTVGERLALRLSGPEGERIVVIDPLTGQTTGSITLAAPGK
jgi:hypothetical protein